MKFFSMDAACDTLETGSVYPQVESMKDGYNYQASNSIHKLRFDETPKEDPDLDYFILEDKANPTDLLSTWVSFCGLLISARLKEILLSHKLQSYRVYTAKVVHKGVELLGYYWFLPIGDESESVDFDKTNFYAEDTFGKKQNLEINNYKDLTNIQKKIGYTSKIKTEKVVFKKEFEIWKDLFRIGCFDYNIYISQGLKNTIKDKKLTGIKFKKADFI